MRIAHVSPEYYPAIGGVGTVVRELSERQAKEGHQVHVFVPDWDKEKRLKIKEEVINGVHIHRCFHIAKIANFNTLWPSVLFRLINGKFDIIHSHNFGHPHMIFSALAAKISKANNIHTTHCPWSDAKRSIVGKMGVIVSYSIFSKLAMKNAHKIIAITPWEISFIKKYGGKKSQIEVIPNGMSSVFFNKIENNDFRKKHNIAKNKRLVLFLGRLNQTKGPDKFVEIAKIILKDRMDIIFVIRGPDEGMKPIVKKMIGDEKQIILLDKTLDKTELIKTYQSADIFVMPSYREGLPLTLFEAYASGLPVIATPVNGIPYELKEKENGFLVKYGDNTMFKKRIIELLDNKRLREKISKNNIQKAKQYDWDIINKKIMILYKG